MARDKVTIREVANAAGVSIATVSYVINNRTDVKISNETIGQNRPNTPMLGALVKVIGTLDIDGVLKDTRAKLEVKFRSKPEVIDGNIASIQRAYDEVKNS